MFEPVFGAEQRSHRIVRPLREVGAKKARFIFHRDLPWHPTCFALFFLVHRNALWGIFVPGLKKAALLVREKQPSVRFVARNA